MTTRAGGSTETWYVISSTDAQMVNILPLALEDFREVENVLILLGMSGNNDAVDRQNAIQAKQRFIDAVLYETRRTNLNKEIGGVILEGDCDDLMFWKGAVADYFRQREAKCDITFNYTSGRKDMSIGALLGLQQLAAENDDIHCRFLAKHKDSICYPFENGRRVTVPQHENVLSLEAYLLAHGFQEFLRDERIAKQKVADRRWPMTKELVQLIHIGGNSHHIDERLAVFGLLPAGAHFNPQMIASRVASQFGQNEHHGDGYDITRRLIDFFSHDLSPFFHEHKLLENGRISNKIGGYLSGDWFEEWVWGRLCRDLPDVRKHIYFNLKLMSSKTDQSNPHGDFELDIAIYLGNQLHYFECKNRKKGADMAIDRLHAAKRRFLKIYGLASLFWARSMEPDAHMRSIAKSSGISLYAGLQEIDQALVELRDMFSAD